MAAPAVFGGLDAIRAQVFSYLFVLAVAIGLFFLIRITGRHPVGPLAPREAQDGSAGRIWEPGIFLFRRRTAATSTSLNWDFIPDFSWFDPISDFFEGS